jgi:hypothetical protein
MLRTIHRFFRVSRFISLPNIPGSWYERTAMPPPQHPHAGMQQVGAGSQHVGAGAQHWTGAHVATGWQVTGAAAQHSHLQHGAGATQQFIATQPQQGAQH